MRAPVRGRRLAALVGVALVTTALGGCSAAGAAGPPGGVTGTGAAAAATGAATGGAVVGSDSTAPASAPETGPGTALALLARIPVEGRAPATGYEREGDFGQAWLDRDHDGCDTRDEVLARDLRDVDRPDGCRVLSGSLVSPYTGATIAFTRGETTSAAVQIDHVVALEDAWQTGAAALTQEEREDLANDVGNLLAVDGSSNEQKGSGDAATWLPHVTGFRCAYVARQVSVKAAYRLWVTPAEHDAIARVLASCPTQPADPTEFGAGGPGGATAGPGSAPVSTTSAAPAVPAAPARPSTVTYANCAAVRAAGAAPLHVGDPGYSRQLDRDGDGTACED